MVSRRLLSLAGNFSQMATPNGMIFVVSSNFEPVVIYHRTSNPSVFTVTPKNIMPMWRVAMQPSPAGKSG